MYTVQLMRYHPPGKDGAYLLPRKGILCSVDAPTKSGPHYDGDTKHVEFVFNGEELLQAYDGMFPCKIPLDLLPYGQCWLSVSVDVAPDFLTVYMEEMPAFGQLHDFGTFCPIITVVSNHMTIPLRGAMDRIIGTRRNQMLIFTQGNCFTAIRTFPMKIVPCLKL